MNARQLVAAVAAVAALGACNTTGAFVGGDPMPAGLAGQWFSGAGGTTVVEAWDLPA